MNFNRLLGFAAVVAVAGGLALAFVFLGSPAHQRRITIDERRTGDLIGIAGTVHDRFAVDGLPERLAPRLAGSDPVTHRRYEYRRVDARHYVLCAIFDTDQPSENGGEYAEHWIAWPHGAWRHGIGRTCYEIDATEPDPVPQRL